MHDSLDGASIHYELEALAQKRLTLTLLGITIFVSATLAHSRTKSSRLMRRMLCE